MKYIWAFLAITAGAWGAPLSDEAISKETIALNYMQFRDGVGGPGGLSDYIYNMWLKPETRLHTEQRYFPLYEQVIDKLMDVRVIDPDSNWTSISFIAKTYAGHCEKYPSFAHQVLTLSYQQKGAEAVELVKEKMAAGDDSFQINLLGAMVVEQRDEEFALKCYWAAFKQYPVKTVTTIIYNRMGTGVRDVFNYEKLLFECLENHPEVIPEMSKSYRGILLTFLVSNQARKNDFDQEKTLAALNQMSIYRKLADACRGVIIEIVSVSGGYSTSMKYDNKNPDRVLKIKISKQQDL